MHALRFGQNHPRRNTLLLLGALLLTPSMSACKRSEPDIGRAGSLLQNVLLVTLDTTRADHIGCYEHAGAQTPTIDNLARRGVLFEHAVSPVPMTLPAHTSIMTGLYPREHGVRVNGQNTVPDTVVTLAELFQKRGARTGAFVAAFVLHSSFGLNQGFDTFDDDIERVGDDQFDLAAERPADVITDRALKWLSSSSDPFFCWIHYYDAHDPYEPPPPYNFTVGNPYDGEIAFVDAQLKRVLDWLDQSGLRDRTLVVVVGDHGEAFGEHQESGHVMFVYETNIHVPLVMAHSGSTRAGLRVGQVVGLTDIAPTIVDLFGIDGLSGSGRSLAAALRGEPLEPRPVYAESHYPHYSYGWAQQRSLVTDKWKYVASTKPELFDLTADPNEMNNRIDSEIEMAARMRSALVQMYEAMPPAVAASAALNDEARERLETLGYASAGSTIGSDEFMAPGAPDPKDKYHVLTGMRRSKALTDQFKWSEALPLLEEAARQSPGAFNIGEKLATCYEKLGRKREAIETWRNVIEANPGHLLSLIKLSELLITARRTDDAVKHLELALALDERSARVHAQLARAMHQAGKLEQAEGHARRALELSPTFAPAVFVHGAVLAKLGRVDEAIEIFSRAAEQVAMQEEANYNLAVLALRQGRTDDAIRRFISVVTLAPTNRRAIGGLLKIYRDQHRVSDMVAVLRRALDADPDNLSFTFSLAQLLAASSEASVRNGSEAVLLARRAVDLAVGDNPEVLAVLAAAYAEQGMFDKAQTTASEALTVARRVGAAALAKRIESQLAGYRAKRPHREPGL